MHVNALNSTTMETSYSGGVSSDVLVYPWGDMGKNPVQSAYQFAGTIWMDGYSSADFAAYRLYRYDQGRWLTPDPLGGDVTNPQSLNRYAYVLNNPASLTDPLGLSGCRFGAHSIGPGQCEDDIPGGGIHWPVMWLMDLFQMMSQTECYYEKNCVNFTMWGGMTFASLLASSAAANNGPNPRLLNIAQQIQNCPSFSNVGNQIAQGVNSGSISVGNVPSNVVATTNGYFNPTSVIAPDALDDPSTVIHEWIHQTQAAGNPFFIFLKGANQIQSLFTSDSQGFLDYSAQAVANKIVSVCGVK